MKKFIQNTFFLTAISLSSVAYAEDIANMNGKNMQIMMAQMQQMQQCLQQIDETELRQYENKISTLEPELTALCKQGKRDEAQTKAIAFGKDVASSDSIKTITHCTKNMQLNGFMPEIPDFDHLGDRHICEELPAAKK